jgi:hypothetical protein
MSDMRKQSRRREGRKRMDRRVGDRRSGGLPPAPDTPAKHDTGRRRRNDDAKAPSSSDGDKSHQESAGKPPHA